MRPREFPSAFFVMPRAAKSADGISRASLRAGTLIISRNESFSGYFLPVKRACGAARSVAGTYRKPRRTKAFAFAARALSILSKRERGGRGRGEGGTCKIVGIK